MNDCAISSKIRLRVRQFVQVAAAELGVKLRFQGNGESEVSVVIAIEGGRAKCTVDDVIVNVGPRYFRPTEVQT